jgi:alpha-galactosidase
MINDSLPAIPDLTLLRPDTGTQLTTRVVDATAVELTTRAANGSPGLRFEVDLADAVGYWQPGLRGARTLPPDWAAPTVTSLVLSAPAGALYNAAGEVLFGWAASEAVAELSVRFGVSEERKSFTVEVRPIRPIQTDLVIIMDAARSGLADTIRRLGAWLSARCAGDILSPPPIARQPVYSTWYAFTEDIDADRITAEAKLAAQLGCGSVFIDHGWQRHCDGRGFHGCGDGCPTRSSSPTWNPPCKPSTSTARASRSGSHPCSSAATATPTVTSERSPRTGNRNSTARSSIPVVPRYAPSWSTPACGSSPMTASTS